MYMRKAEQHTLESQEYSFKMINNDNRHDRHNRHKNGAEHHIYKEGQILGLADTKMPDQNRLHRTGYICQVRLLHACMVYAK